MELEEEKIIYRLSFSIVLSDYYVAILAGGRSERFGMNKALFKFNGKSFLSQTIMKTCKLSIIPKRLFISLNDDSQFQRTIGHLEKELNIQQIMDSCWELDNGDMKKVRMQFIYDSIQNEENVRAAIFGINSVCNHVEQGFVHCVPCDTPFFPTSIMNEFISMMHKWNHEMDAIIPKWNNGFIEALHGLYRVESIRPIIVRNLEKGIYKLSDLLTQDLKVRYFNIDEHLCSDDPTFRPFQNINTMKDLTDLYQKTFDRKC